MAGLIERFGRLGSEERKRGRWATRCRRTRSDDIKGNSSPPRPRATIYGRVTALYGGNTPTPEQIIDHRPRRPARGRTPRAKAAYLRSLAEHIIDGELPVGKLAQMPDEEVYERLVAVKGLGPWTVDMFLMFHLGRPDVLPVGDLGIRRADPARVRTRRAPETCRDGGHRRGMEAAPHPRLPLPLGIA